MGKHAYWDVDSKGFTVTLPLSIVKNKPLQFDSMSAWVRDILKNGRYDVYVPTEKIVPGYTEKDRSVLKFWYSIFKELFQTIDGKKALQEIVKKFPQLASMATEWDTMMETLS